eukprot:TRINITY_DN2362_c1_g1_i3.p1 TRINITY_DN2362_c1_g1~~TRINITY_DN2362_c1_g1_i3.p1  ORF type:complete len:124 (+),score=30.34 TRINITY_DN2362_c1_g1_i3:38-373(+)
MGRLEKSCVPLFVACSQDDKEMVSLLIENGSWLEIGFHSNPPPSNQVMRMLLERGAKPNWIPNSCLRDEETYLMFLEKGGDLLSGRIDLRRCVEAAEWRLDSTQIRLLRIK